MELNLKVGDRVNMITMHGPTRGSVMPATIVAIYKNGIYKVLPDNRIYDNYCYRFRPDGRQCGYNWKDWSYMYIEKLEDN